MTEKKEAPKKEPETKKAAPAKTEAEAKAPAKKAETGKAPAASKPATKKPAAKETPAKTAAKAPAKKAPAKASKEDEDVQIVEEGEAPETPYVVKVKPQLSAETKKLLAVRKEIDERRPGFRRQQWFEYKRLERSGWRKPTGQDSAQRRHFGYRPPVVRVGYRGPAAVRGLHASGFEEVRVENVKDLTPIDPKTQAARVSGSVGRRKLEAIYAEADKRKIRILNRRSI